MPAQSKIDWLAARNDYLADPTMSYTKIAERYGVSNTAVELRAKKEGWVELRNRLGEKVALRAEEKIVDELSEINMRHSQSYKVIQAIGLESANMQLDWMRNQKKLAELSGNPVNPKDVISFQGFKFLAEGMEVGIKGERITRNMPTASVTEVKHTGVIATLDLTPAQIEGVINAGNSAEDVLAGRDSRYIPRQVSQGESSEQS